MDERSTQAGRAACLPGILCAALAGLLDPCAAAQTTAAYRDLDDVAGPWVELNLTPVRPLAVTPDFEVFAVNTAASTVERFAGLTSEPLEVWRAPWGPVSIAHWTHPATGVEQLLVVCRGSHVLARYRRADGRVLALVSLPHEPADLVVVGDLAFVSCSGAEVVVELDLVTGARVEYSEATHPGFRCEQPFHLCPDGAGGVLVAPRLSGNDTCAEQALGRRAGDRVLDLADPAVAVRGLPDEDLFRIDPGAGTVTPVARATGTVLFGHGLNPATGRHWQLGTEAKNADPRRQTEAALRGDFVQNRLAITALGPADPLPTPERVVDLDDVDPAAPGVQRDRLRGVGQPIALAFGRDGSAFVAGLLTDSLTLLDAEGARLADWDLPAGSIPRAVLLVEEADAVLVHCWGTNEIRVRRLSDMRPLVAYRLSRDPTPAGIREGRRIFYDGRRSLHGNASCASCHVDAGTDLVVWNLSAPPYDDKGPMTTQTLAGLGRMAPFHWRGERRALADFNGAFASLLGAAPLEPDALAALEAYLLAIQVPANPQEAAARVVDDARVPAALAGASAVAGQVLYYEEPVFAGTLACNDCHALPLGTQHDIVAADTEVLPKRVHMKVPPLHELWRKLQGEAEIELWRVPGDPGAGSVVVRRARLGAGLTHAGLEASLAEFLELFALDAAQRAHLAAFVLQVDSGLAPCVHRALLLDERTRPVAEPELVGLLLFQAQAGSCDLAAFGTALVGGSPTAVSWAWERSSGLFRPDAPVLAPRTLQAFLDAVADESHVFLGLPRGTALSFAVDRDRDGLVDAADPEPDQPHVDPTDRTPPTFTTAPHVPWVTTRTARLAWETDEPTAFRVTWVSGAGDAHALGDLDTAVPTEHARVHAVLLEDLLPSTATGNGDYGPVAFDYAVTVEVADRAGNRASHALPALVRSGAFTDAEELRDELVVGALAWTSFDDRLPGRVRATAALRVDYERGGPPAVPAAGRLVVCRLLVDGAVSADIAALGARAFRADAIRAVDATGNELLLPLEGPFLVARPSDVHGRADLAFELTGLAPGARVTLSVEAVLRVDPARAAELLADLVATDACSVSAGPLDRDCDGDGVPDCCGLDVPVEFAPRAFTRWSHPDTPEAYRALDEVVDPRRPTRLAPPSSR